MTASPLWSLPAILNRAGLETLPVTSTPFSCICFFFPLPSCTTSAFDRMLMPAHGFSDRNMPALKEPEPVALATLTPAYTGLEAYFLENFLGLGGYLKFEFPN